MVIEKDRVVTIGYKLRDSEGEIIDSSEDSDPLVYLHGNENIIPGLEKHLHGKVEGDLVDCVIPAEEAYGLRDESLVFTVGKAEFGPDASIEPGMQFEAHGQNGAQVVTVVGIVDDDVTIDANHPLAGEELHFHVEVKGIREATAEELERGHVHGACSCGCEGEECGDGECAEGGSGCGCGG
jgi:FKBP-type peptidyl-prolyl cis-trans isomerase SlyD